MRTLSRKAATLSFWLAAIGWLVACQKPSAVQEKPFFVCTTGMLGSSLRQLVGERARVETLMRPGVDPHLYKATTSDVLALRRARVIFYNGLHLEGKMQEVLQHPPRPGQWVLAVAEQLPEEDILRQGQQPDPHIWFDVELWRKACQKITETLCQADPEGRELYLKNGQRFDGELEELHRWCLQQAATLPQPRRITVTSHDAFSYFGRAYGFEVIGLQGLSTSSEAGLRDVTQLVDFLRRHRVPAIFVESSVPRVTLERVAKDSGVKIGGELFSDSIGAEGTPEGTYPGMIRHNMETVVRALR